MSAEPVVVAEREEVTSEGPPTRRLVIMVVSAAVLACAVALTVLPGLAPPVPTRVGEPLVDLDPGKVRSIGVELRDGTAFAFTRSGGGWQLARGSSTSDVPADRLDGFLQTLAGLTRLVEIGDQGVVPAEFGLDPPRARLVLQDGKEVSLAIGDRNPPLTGLYVQVLPSPKIVLVGAVLLWEFDKLAALARS